MYVAPPEPNGVPAAMPIPIDRNDRDRMLARWPGLFIQATPIERGVYVTRLWYANVVRPKETLITAVTRDGTFLIENGRVTRPLRDLRLTDSVLRILSRTSALSRDQTLTSDGEFYGRRFAFGVVSPAIRADAVRFTGAAG